MSQYPAALPPHGPQAHGLPASGSQATGASPSGTWTSGFLESLIRFLMPFFIGTAADIHAARAEIIETLSSYGTRTRGEALSAARIIAFGMTSLDALMEAKAGDLSPSMRLRLRGCANGLNRSTLQLEKALDRQLGYDLPPAFAPLEQAVNDMPDGAVEAGIADAQAALAQVAQRNAVLSKVPGPTVAVPAAPVPANPVPANPVPANPLPTAAASNAAMLKAENTPTIPGTDPSGTRPPANPRSDAVPPLPQEDPDKLLWAGPLMETLRRMGLPDGRPPGG